MSFAHFRNKIKWAALAGGLLIVVGQWLLHDLYVDREVWVDRTPAALNFLGMVVTVLTLILALLAIPRWQSLVAGIAILWVIFIWIQGI